MKKIVSVLLMALMVTALCVPFMSSAATIDDVVAELDKNPTAVYFKDAIAQIAKNYEISNAQADKLLALAQQYNSVITADKGKSADEVINGHYTAAERAAVVDIVKQGCAVMGWNYSTSASTAPQHKDDIVVTITDGAGNVICRFDGDVAPFLVEYVGQGANKKADDSGNKNNSKNGSSVVAKTGTVETTSVVVAVIAVVAVIGTGYTAVRSSKQNS